MSKKKRKSRVDSSPFRQPDLAPKKIEFTAPSIPADTTAERPWFSFRHICQKEFAAKRCSYEKLKAYSDKLRQLSELEWKVIESSPRETNGYELIPLSQIKGTIPEKFSKHDAMVVFRFGGCGNVASKTSGRIAGVREKERFYVLFVDSSFSLYDHGS